MDVEDSLELLSSQFTNPTVRRYAVARLQQADDEVSRKRGCIFAENTLDEEIMGVQGWILSPGRTENPTEPARIYTSLPPVLQSSLPPLFLQDLLMYLLQLVQALKYENFSDIQGGLEPGSR